MAQQTWMICSNPTCTWAIEWPRTWNPNPDYICEERGCEAPALARCRRCGEPITSKTAFNCKQCHQPLRGPLPIRQLTVTALLGEVVAALGHRGRLTQDENRWIRRKWPKGLVETEVEHVVAELRSRRGGDT